MNFMISIVSVMRLSLPRKSRSRLIVGLFFLANLAGNFGCQTAQTTDTGETANGQADESQMTPAQVHHQRIERYSAGDTEYSGLYNNFEFRATLLNAEVRDSLISRQASYFQWDRDKTMSEREKSRQESSTTTTVFVSFYTPDRHNDNLADVKSIWRIYLDAGGKRYAGKAKKIRLLLVEVQELYPYHTRWNSPYTVEFPVSTNAIETQRSSLTITGPLGTRTVEFSAQR